MKFLYLILPMLLVACAVNKIPQATGGSKADGTVVLSYSHGGFEKPVVDWATAQQTAIQRCQAWGYKNADGFGGQNVQCLAYNAYGCVNQQVNVTYQCLD